MFLTFLPSHCLEKVQTRTAGGTVCPPWVHDPKPPNSGFCARRPFRQPLPTLLSSPAAHGPDSGVLSPGVRTLKYLLPPHSERERQGITTDKNAWVGVPVGIAKRRPPQVPLGPSPRPGTCTAKSMSRRSGGGDPGAGSKSEHCVALKYNWLPASVVANVSLLQTPINDQ